MTPFHLSWTSTSAPIRRELHPDGFPPVDRLLDWIGVRARASGNGGAETYAGYRRFCEDAATTERLVLKNGAVLRRT